MRWNTQSYIDKLSDKDRIKQILTVILKNRGFKEKADIKNFIHPKDPFQISPEEVGFNKEYVKKSIERIRLAIKNNQQIIIFGDYDADGITATAILWETLNKIGANVFPFIPHRENHGYGLSTKAIDDLLLDKNPQLIITVDNGIVAHEAAKYIHQKGIDLIITDHHVASDDLPIAHSIIHSTDLAGAGVSWVFSKEITKNLKKEDSKKLAENTIDLATIGTVADQVPLINFNRSIVKEGLKYLSKTKRVGLLELYQQADFRKKEINTYDISFIIAPRINAMGRLAHGLDSLRLLCTRDKKRAKNLSQSLNTTNQDRRDITFELLQVANEIIPKKENKIIIIDHQDFHEGVIGLVAGKITETHYRPTIVIGVGEEISKASARSISGVNIIEMIRLAESHLINAGGHPMAAGFTIKTSKIEDFKKNLYEIANQQIKDEYLIPEIFIECEISIKDISWDLLEITKKLEPYGMENRKPVFSIKNVNILEKYKIGKEKNHLKLIIPSKIKGQSKIDALWFGHGEDEGMVSEKADLAFTIDENTWNGNTSLQVIIKDIKPVD